MRKRSAVGVVLLLVILAGGSLSMDAGPAPEALAFSEPDASLCEEGYGVPNPADVLCGELGYRIRSVRGVGGERSVCVFPDGSSCEAWQFYQGKCGEAYSYCARQGYRQITKTDGADPFSPQYAVCVDDGVELGSVTDLTGLGQRYNKTILPEQGPVSPGPPPESFALPAALPATFDWRNHNGQDWITGVRNQSSCGSCWAFSAVGATEAVYNIATSSPNLDLDLSEEFLNSDCPSPNPGTCCGGWHHAAMGILKNDGIPDEACMPYDVSYYGTGSCGCGAGGCNTLCNGLPTNCSNLTCGDQCADWATRLITIADYHAVPSNQADIKQKLVDEGPISVCLSMSGDFDTQNVYNCDTCWDLNNNGTCELAGVCGTGNTCTSGVIGRACNTDADCDEDRNDDGVCNQDDCGITHCVVIVGYDDAGGFWMAKNSWGTGWNGTGYFDVGYGECHIERLPYYVEAADLEFPPIADANGPYSGDEGAAVSFDGTGSSDPNGDPVTYAWDFGDGDTGTGATPSHTYDDDGLNPVCLTVTDDGGLSAEDCTTADIDNVAPTATFNYPTEVDEGDSFVLSLTGPYDPSSADTAAGFEYNFDCGGGYHGWSSDNTITCQTFDSGTLDVKGKIRDKDGDATEYTAEVTVNNLPPVVSVDITEQTIQYSDHICDVTFTATDVARDSLTASSTLPDSLVLTSESCVVSGDGIWHTCTWTLEGTIDEPEGTYPITFTVTDGDGGSASESTTVVVEPEDAKIWLDSENPVAVQVAEDGGNSGEFTLVAYVQETTPDDAVCAADPGDIDDAQVSISLVPVGPGSTETVVCTNAGVSGSGYDAILTVECDFDDIPVNVYHVQATVVGGYYISGIAEDVVVIFDPSLGFTTGGGWFYWPGTSDSDAGYPGDRTNFGFTMKYNKKHTNIRGSLLLIRHMEDGSIYRVKSNALRGLSIGDFEAGDQTVGWASFAGKCTYLEPGWEEAIGNYRFLVYVEDWNEPGAGYDQFWLEITDKDLVRDGDMSMARPASENTMTIDGGNVVVPHNPD